METFTLGGDPSSIRASATLWGTFSTNASGASTDIKGVNTEEWVGDESVLYRGRINKDLVPHLDVTAQAWGIVRTALHTYAGHLETLQSQMSTLRVQHGHQQTVVNNAQASYGTAKSADKSHHDSRQTAQQNLTAGQTLPADTYHAQSGGALSHLQTAQQDLQNLVTKAGVIRTEHAKHLKACCDEIGRAKKLRPVEPPGFWDKVKHVAGVVWDGAKKGVAWAAEHLGPVLKIISAVAGLLALIPCLTPIMGPIALATGAAALMLDVLNKLMNGKGSWLQIGIDAVGLIPGVKSLTSVAKVAKVAKAGKALDEAGQGVKGARSAFMLASKNTRMAKVALGVEKGAGRNVFVRGAKGLFNRGGIRNAENALASSRSTLATSKTALNAAKSRYATQAANFAKAEKYAKYHDTAWKVVDPLASSAGTTLIGVKTYKDTNGDWAATARAVGVSALGQKIPGAGNKFNAIQGIVSNGAATVNQGYNMATNPEKLTDPVEWAKLGASGVKTGTSVHTVATAGSAGTQSNATGASGSHENSAYSRSAFSATNQTTATNNGVSNFTGMLNSIVANSH